MKINVFLSVTGREGIELAELLKKNLESYGTRNGIGFCCFLYIQNQKVGHPVVESYIAEIDKSNCFVPILTREYCEWNRIHVKTELERAKQKEKDLFARHGVKYKFIFPYAPKDGESLIEKIPLLSGLIFATNAETLAKAMLDYSQVSVTYKGEAEIGFGDWPRRFFTLDGDPNILLVLGHTGKESPPEREDIRNLGISGMDEDIADRYLNKHDKVAPIMPTQSMRIAEYLPILINFLSNYYLALKPKSRTIPAFPTEIDWHLIKHRREILETHNLICFGAGDTNWISRAVLSYYATLLPVSFGLPDSSHVIFYRSMSEPNVNLDEEDTSGLLVYQENIKVIQKTPVNNDHYSGILLLLPNPWNENKKVIVAAGLTGIGSQATIKALCDPSISVITPGGTPWARVIRAVEGEDDQALKAIDFDIIV